jgi:hypothetical protein
VVDSPSRNAYAIYLLHDAFLTWRQFALLAAPLPAVLKATLAFSGAVLLSWSSAAALRRLPGVARVL